MGTRHFKTKEKYQRWLAWGHMHGEFEATPGHQTVKIRGKTHRVRHAKK